MRQFKRTNIFSFGSLRTRDGSAVVEFVLVIPVFVLLSWVIVDVGLMAVQQLLLENLSAEAARRLSLSSFNSADEMRAAVETWLAGRFRTDPMVDVRIQPLPSLPEIDPLRQTKNVEVIELRLQQPVASPFSILRAFRGLSAFSLTSSAREIRIRPEG